MLAALCVADGGVGRVVRERGVRPRELGSVGHDRVEITSEVLDTAGALNVAGERAIRTLTGPNAGQWRQRGSAAMVRYGEDDQSGGRELPGKGAPPPANEPPLLPTLVWFLIALAAVVVLTLLAQEPGIGIGI